MRSDPTRVPTGVPSTRPQASPSTNPSSQPTTTATSQPTILPTCPPCQCISSKSSVSLFLSNVNIFGLAYVVAYFSYRYCSRRRQKSTTTTSKSKSETALYLDIYSPRKDIPSDSGSVDLFSSPSDSCHCECSSSSKSSVSSRCL